MSKKYKVLEASGVTICGKAYYPDQTFSTDDVTDLIDHMEKTGAIKEVKVSSNKAITTPKNTKGVK